MNDPRDATPAVNALITEYLKRRTSQRQYLDEVRFGMVNAERQAVIHADEIARLNRLLYALGYKGH